MTILAAAVIAGRRMPGGRRERRSGWPKVSISPA
jgi:hypothetical protein